MPSPAATADPVDSSILSARYRATTVGMVALVSLHAFEVFDRIRRTEEIAIPRHALSVLGPLDDVHTMASGFTVSPWVAHHPGGRPDMTPEQSEIARIMEVPLADVLAADLRIPEPPDLRTLRYPLQGEDVWGLTARILRTFSAVVHAVAAPGARP